MCIVPLAHSDFCVANRTDLSTGKNLINFISQFVILYLVSDKRV